jgi:hypothetical protein
LRKSVIKNKDPAQAALRQRANGRLGLRDSKGIVADNALVRDINSVTAGSTRRFLSRRHLRRRALRSRSCVTAEGGSAGM